MFDWFFKTDEKKQYKDRKIDPDEQFRALYDEVRRDFFNCMIFGKTKSGKTHFLLNTLFPMVRDQYSQVYVFSRMSNEREYKEAIPRCVFVSENHLQVLMMILMVQQNKNIDELRSKKEKKTVYKDNILIIWDDFLDEKTFKDDQFKSQFFNGRHYQCSIIVLSQVSNRVISTDLRGNTQISVFFKIVDQVQSRACMGRISECLANLGVPEKELFGKAMKIKRDHIDSKPYGFVAITDSSDFLYPDVKSMLDKEHLESREPYLTSSDESDDSD